MKKRLYICLFLLINVYALAQAPETNLLGKYCNARFSYCIDYPKSVLMAQPESDNGDGRVFRNKKGATILTVFGRINQDINGKTLPLKAQFEADINDFTVNSSKSDKITYQKLGKTFYVLSGYKNGMIFYQKTILKADSFCVALVEYPEAEKEQYKVLPEIVFKSFK